MSVIFCGGEAGDFTGTAGAPAISQTAGHFRSDRARCAVSHTAGGTKAVATFDPTTLVWLGAQSFNVLGGTASNATWSGDLVTFREAGVARLIIRAVYANGVKTLRIITVADGGAETIKATGSVAYTTPLSQLAVYVMWREVGQISIWRGGTLIVSWTGDPRPGESLELDSMLLGGPDSATGSATHWSEVIVTGEEDVREMSLQTLVPTGVGDISQWAGTYTHVDEVVASSADLMESSTSGFQATLTTTGIGTATNNHSVVAVKVVADAARSSTGPSILKLGVRQSGTSSYPVQATLDTSYGPQQALLTTNPITATAWTIGDLATTAIAFQTVE